MYDAGVLPFDNATIDEMNDIFGKLIMIDITSTTEDDEFDRIDTEFHDVRDAALSAHDESDYATHDEYVEAVGETFWMSLTATEVVKVLLGAITFA